MDEDLDKTIVYCVHLHICDVLQIWQSLVCMLRGLEFMIEEQVCMILRVGLLVYVLVIFYELHIETKSN